MLPELQFPAIELSCREEAGSLYFRDVWRKKDVLLTPEEWVRQHVLFYFKNQLGVPESLIAVEREIQFNRQRKRFDVLIYHPDGFPLLLTECKAPHIPLKANVISQIAVYNQVTDASYLFITNGLQHMYLARKNKQAPFEPQQHMRVWAQMLGFE